MNKSTLILIGIGIAVGYFLSDNLVTLAEGKTPFATARTKGMEFAN